MKKMKKSALAAAVLLSLSMMGSAYAENTYKRSETLKLDAGADWYLNEQPGAPFDKVNIDVKGETSALNITNGTTAYLDCGNIVISSTGSETNGILVQKSSAIYINQENTKGTIDIYGGRRGVNVNASTLYMDGNVINSLVDSAGYYGLDVQGGGIAYIGQNNIHGELYFKGGSEYYGICVRQGSKAYIDANKIMSVGYNGISIPKNNGEGTKIFIGEKNPNAEVMFVGENRAIYVATKGEMYLTAKTVNLKTSENVQGSSGTVYNAGTLNITAGPNGMTWNSGAISGTGTTNISGNVTMTVPSIENIVNVAEDAQATFNGTTVKNAVNVAQNAKLTFAGDNTKYNIALIVGNNPAVTNMFTIDGTASGTLKIGDVNITGTEADWTQVENVAYCASSTEKNKIELKGENIVYYGNYKYTITPGSTGTINVEQGAGYSFEEVVSAQTGKIVFSEYKLGSNYTAKGELGTLGQYGGESRNLTIDVNGKVLEGSKCEGIKVGKVDELTVTNTANTNEGKAPVISGWKTYFIQNTGTLNIGGTKGITLQSPITGEGTTNIIGTVAVTVSSKGAITQGNLNIAKGASLTINPDKLNIDNNAGTIVNDGTLTLNAAGTLDEAVNGNGTLKLSGKNTVVTVDSTINNAITLANNTTLNISANKVGGAITGNDTATASIVNLDAGTLNYKISKGTVNFNGDVTTVADNIAGTTNTVADGKTLTVNGGNLTGQTIGVEGTGVIKLKGDFAVDCATLSGAALNADVSVDSTFTLTLSNITKADVNKTFTIVSGDVSGDAWGNLSEGEHTKEEGISCLKLGKVKVFEIDKTGGFAITVIKYGASFVEPGSTEDGIQTSIYNVATVMSDSENEKVQNFMDALSDIEDNQGTAAASNAIETVANMSAVAGVQSGTASMVNSVANNLVSNLGSSARPNLMSGNKGGLRNTAADNGEVKIDTVEVGKAANVMPERYLAKAYNKEVWASYIHSKQHVDGLKAGMLDSKSVNQYNGVTVGADLWSGKHSFGGVALSYADGNVNAGNLRNDTDYYGVSIYNRHDYKGLTMLTDVSYTHSKNDINISGTQEITADAKADAIGVGVRFETPVTMGKTTVTPYAGARYTYLKNKDYDNNLGMNYDTDNQNLVTIPVGLEISAEFAMPKSDWTFRPALEGGYVWNLGDRDGNTKIGYMGAYDIVGFETSDPGQYFIRAAMQFAKADFTCAVGYRYSKGKSVRDNRWNISLNYAF